MPNVYWGEAAAGCASITTTALVPTLPGAEAPGYAYIPG